MLGHSVLRAHALCRPKSLAMCLTIRTRNSAATAKNHPWPGRESTPAAEERLSTRYHRVELLTLSPQLHKIHYSQRWSQNTIKQKRGKRQRLQDCTSAGMPHRPEVCWSGRWRTDPWDNPFCSSICSTPKPQTVQMAENTWPRRQQKHNPLNPPSFPWDRCRNTRRLWKLHPWRRHQHQRLMLSGSRAGRHVTLSPNISFRKRLG